MDQAEAVQALEETLALLERCDHLFREARQNTTRALERVKEGRTLADVILDFDRDRMLVGLPVMTRSTERLFGQIRRTATLALLDGGWTFTQIGRVMGVSRQRAWKFAQDTLTPEELARYKAHDEH